MLCKVRVEPLAAESLGVRSMCTYVETPNLRLLLDAGVSLSPNRFRLPPHPQEFEAIKKTRKKIVAFAEKADVITISHYHFDHHTPSFEDWLCNWTHVESAQQVYEGKLVLAKDYRVDINPSQRLRGSIFEKTGGKHADKLIFVDGKNFHFNGTELKFSRPVFHGLPNTPIGWVLMTQIEYEGERVLFAPDVQGPMDDVTVQIILNQKPQLLIIGGPALYLKGLYVNDEQIRRGLRNLEILAGSIPVVIVDHHLLRDLEWRNSTTRIFAVARETGNTVVTAAEFLGSENQLLEAKRRRLFRDFPPNSEFIKWTKKSKLKRGKTKPPFSAFQQSKETGDETRLTDAANLSC